MNNQRKYLIAIYLKFHDHDILYIVTLRLGTFVFQEVKRLGTTLDSRNYLILQNCTQPERGNFNSSLVFINTVH